MKLLVVMDKSFIYFLLYYNKILKSALLFTSTDFKRIFLRHCEEFFTTWQSHQKQQIATVFFQNFAMTKPHVILCLYKCFLEQSHYLLKISTIKFSTNYHCYIKYFSLNLHSFLRVQILKGIFLK